jgi:hypothetical protein
MTLLLNTICWTWSNFQFLIHVFITKDLKTHSFHSHKFFEPWTFNFHIGTCPCLEVVINFACTICYGWCSNCVINELFSFMFKLPFKDTTCFIGFGHNGKTSCRKHSCVNLQCIPILNHWFPFLKFCSLVLYLCIIFSFPKGKNLNVVKGLMNPISIATYKLEVTKKNLLLLGQVDFSYHPMV